MIRRLVSLNIQGGAGGGRERKAIAYIKSGEKAQSLMAGREKVVLCGHFSERSHGTRRRESVPENEKKLRELEERCLEESSSRWCWLLVGIIIQRTRSTMSTRTPD